MRHPALILPLLLAIPGAVIAKLTASPPSPEAGKVSLGAAVVQAPDDSTERPAAATLRRAFECQSLDKAIDAALAANGIALDGSPSKLATSIRVFGLSTSTDF